MVVTTERGKESYLLENLKKTMMLNDFESDTVVMSNTNDILETKNLLISSHCHGMVSMCPRSHVFSPLTL